MNRNLKKRFDEAVTQKIFVIAWCVMMFLFIVGCTPVFIVQKNGDDVNGIPFYIKTAKCLHQSVYVVPYYQITFQVLKDDKVNTTETITISSKAYQSKPVEKFLTLMHQSPETTLQAALNAWRSISNLNNDPYERVTVNDAEWPKYLVANSSAPTVLVDYSNQYTLNAKSPFAGTVNADYKLNEDGTLSEASGQIQEQTLSTVLSPIADVFKTAAGLLKTAMDGGGAEKTEKIEEVAGNSTKDTKSDDNSIKINGTVTLPKSLGATTTTKDASGSKPSSESKSATSDKQKK
jgi:hypothetical protein